MAQHEPEPESPQVEPEQGQNFQEQPFSQDQNYANDFSQPVAEAQDYPAFEPPVAGGFDGGASADYQAPVNDYSNQTTSEDGAFPEVGGGRRRMTSLRPLSPKSMNRNP